MDSRTRAKLIEQIKRQEADKGPMLRLADIGDGCLTGGYGHNFTANPIPGIGPDSVLTQDQCDRLLEHDLLVAEVDVATHIPASQNLSPARLAVLVNMAFNSGIHGVLDFSRMIMCLNSDDTTGAAEEILDSMSGRGLARKNGRIVHLPGLATRYKELHDQMLTGKWRDE